MCHTCSRRSWLRWKMWLQKSKLVYLLPRASPSHTELRVRTFPIRHPVPFAWKHWSRLSAVGHQNNSLPRSPTHSMSLASNNPQTYHQALLLISTLARLCPDSVLRDIMPIFTFMGSNVFHRDDAYSFNVVQQARCYLFFNLIIMPTRPFRQLIVSYQLWPRRSKAKIPESSNYTWLPGSF